MENGDFSYEEISEKKLDEIDADYEDIVAALNRFGTIASKRK